MDFKVAVLSITRDRLDYTKHCFGTLKEKARYPYDHYVYDNGSTDGTQEYLKSLNPHHLELGSENVGISVAMNRLIDSLDKKYDLIIKMDNDCEVVYTGIIRRIVAVYQNMPQLKKMILSPRVEGINNQPLRKGHNLVDNAKIGLTGHVGGLFMTIPGFVVNDMKYRFPETNPVGSGADSHICHWFRQNGGEVGYLEKLVVNHYETTHGQAKRYPEYFKRKRSEA